MLLRDKENKVHQKCTYENMKDFKWPDITQAVDQFVPLLSTAIIAAVTTTKNERSLYTQTNKKKYNCWLKILIYKRQLIKLWVWRNSKMCFIIYRPKDLSLIPAIGLVSAVLLHMRSPRINLVQGLHGVELWRCGAQRKVHWTNNLHSSTCIYPFIFQHDYKIRHVHILLLLRFSYT